MGLILSKVIPPLIYPLGLACLLCLISAYFALRSKPRLAALASILAFLLLYLFSTSALSLRLIHPLEARFPVIEPYPQVAALVLLGGATVPATPPRHYPETNQFGDRLIHTARLWHQNVAPKLITTGGKISWIRDYSSTEAADYATLLRQVFKVDSSAILMASQSRNTYEDALGVAAICEREHIPKEILLVTSAFHMPRAVGVFRKMGFIVHPAPTDFIADTFRPFKFIQLLPSEGCLQISALAIHEYLGLLAYRFKGWL